MVAGILENAQDCTAEEVADMFERAPVFHLSVNAGTFRILPDCVHQIEMSPVLPFRNVTAVGSDDGRRSFCATQRPAGGRLPGARKPLLVPYRAGSARSARRKRSADVVPHNSVFTLNIT